MKHSTVDLCKPPTKWISLSSESSSGGISQGIFCIGSVSSTSTEKFRFDADARTKIFEQQTSTINTFCTNISGRVNGTSLKQNENKFFRKNQNLEKTSIKKLWFPLSPSAWIFLGFAIWFFKYVNKCQMFQDYLWLLRGEINLVLISL